MPYDFILIVKKIKIEVYPIIPKKQSRERQYRPILIFLFNNEYNPFRENYQKLINYDFHNYKEFDKSIALLNHYNLPQNQLFRMFFSQSIIEAMDKSNVADILGIPSNRISKYYISTRMEIPISSNASLYISAI
ncbi:hypothetical protein RCL_jg26643.t1 [Rhizophagus clarus]|uniref:Uncharacterized protein n=1 Tax=Rhizophagus clarus TaxID=94130 RepID=A0A8H3MBN5_9GLOM|nr:hypothetical protein RCL_jg26638.t1 [Rhizophagus clarus]GET02378.1 hypothetical protein RCL_jg26643.t1 [Rhizophagus clarus]